MPLHLSTFVTSVLLLLPVDAEEAARAIKQANVSSAGQKAGKNQPGKYEVPKPKGRVVSTWGRSARDVCEPAGRGAKQAGRGTRAGAGSTRGSVSGGGKYTK